MTAQLATESQWKAVVQKSKIKDNGLQKALAEYEKLGDDKSQEKVKALDAVKKLASGLGKDKAIAANADVAKFLDGLEAGADTAKKDAATAAKAQEANLSEIKGLCGETEKLARSTEDELADLGKNGGGACETFRTLHVESFKRVTEAAKKLTQAGSSESQRRMLDNLIAAINNASHAELALTRCLINTNPHPEFKSHERQLSTLKSQLTRAQSQLRN